MRVPKLLATVTLVVSTLTVHAQDKAFLLEIEPRSQALLGAVNATGAVAVGNFNGGGGLYWMPTSGVVSIGGRFATAVSVDGRTIVGTATDARLVANAAIWQRAAEWRLLGGFADGAPCGLELSQGSGVSRDGAVVVGSAWRGCTAVHAFRWESGTMVDLGSTVAGRSSQAWAVSGDGKVVVGSQTDATGTNFGVRWTDGRQEAFTGPRGRVGTAYAAVKDGTVVVGRQCRPPTPQNPIEDQSAWIWSSYEGMKCLEPPAFRPSATPMLGYALAVSDNARVVGGTQKSGAADAEAVIWIDGEPSYLKDYLRAHGVPNAFNGWINTGELTGVSPDGRVLVGWGAAIGGPRGYLVILNELEPLE